MDIKNIFITGGTGFIGTRFIQKCILDWDYKITALVRDYSRLSRLARFENGTIKYQFGEINKLDTLNEIENVDAVVHFAFDLSSIKKNIIGIKNIIELCKKHNKRLIHISTISVYEPLVNSRINEDVNNIPPKSNKYAYGKYLIEKEVLKEINENLDAIVLQPTIVYGPFGASWTDRIISQINSGTIILPDNGEGICNPVYIDDVCEAINLSCTIQKPKKKKFLISGPDSITWSQFYGEFLKITGKDSLIFKSRNQIMADKRNPLKFFKSAFGNPLMFVNWEPMKSILRSLQYKIPSSIKLWIKTLYFSYKKISPKPVFIPDKNLLDLFTSKSIVEIELARKIIGYSPAFDFKKGMKVIEEYKNWAYPWLNRDKE